MAFDSQQRLAPLTSVVNFREIIFFKKKVKGGTLLFLSAALVKSWKFHKKCEKWNYKWPAIGFLCCLFVCKMVRTQVPPEGLDEGQKLISVRQRHRSSCISSTSVYRLPADEPKAWKRKQESSVERYQFKIHNAPRIPLFFFKKKNKNLLYQH